VQLAAGLVQFGQLVLFGFEAGGVLVLPRLTDRPLQRLHGRTVVGEERLHLLPLGRENVLDLLPLIRRQIQAVDERAQLHPRRPGPWTRRGPGGLVNRTRRHPLAAARTAHRPTGRRLLRQHRPRHRHDQQNQEQQPFHTVTSLHPAKRFMPTIIAFSTRDCHRIFARHSGLA
jgi:hypothetical protein